VLTNDQRSEIGTLYKDDPFSAKRAGAALISANIATILDSEHFRRLGRTDRVLVYCWRGGLRSLSLAYTLSQIGYQVGMIHGGYKRYRCPPPSPRPCASLSHAPSHHICRLNTGTYFALDNLSPPPGATCESA